MIRGGAGCYAAGMGNSLENKHVFVGFGFGAIQAGLFLYEAQCSGNFRQLVVVDVDAALLDALRGNDGFFVVNIAHADLIESVRVGPVLCFNSQNREEIPQIVAWIEQAEELATAVPSTALYTAGGKGSIASLLEAGLTADALVYTAENDTHAAEKLAAAAGKPGHFVNTVIGKMSRIVTDGAEMAEKGLDPICPGLERAFLVEAFNHIYISDTGGVVRGLDILDERSDFVPFEELKLYGHNAIHGVAAYVGGALGCPDMASMAEVPGLMRFLRQVLVKEIGGAMVCRHGSTGAPFTEAGMAAFGDELLERIVNPYLDDTMERVARDPERKLGWEDRLVGALRMCLAESSPAPGLALGVVLAAQDLHRQRGGAESIVDLLRDVWAEEEPDAEEVAAVLVKVEAALARCAHSTVEEQVGALVAGV